MIKQFNPFLKNKILFHPVQHPSSIQFVLQFDRWSHFSHLPSSNRSYFTTIASKYLPSITYEGRCKNLFNLNHFSRRKDFFMPLKPLSLPHLLSCNFKSLPILSRSKYLYSTSFSSGSPGNHSTEQNTSSDSDDTDTNQKNDVFDLKNKMMQIYKLVHPDLFTKFPEQHETNLKSLQKFQNFLDEYKGVENNQMKQNDDYIGVGQHLFMKTYHLSFFIRISPIRNHDYHQSGSSQFQHIEITVSGPPPKCGILEKSHLFSKNLLKILKALQIITKKEADLYWDLLLSKGRNASFGSFDSKRPGGSTQENLDFSDRSILDFIREATQECQFDFEEIDKQGVSPDLKAQQRMAAFLEATNYLDSRKSEIQVHMLRNKIAEFLNVERFVFAHNIQFKTSQSEKSAAYEQQLKQLQKFAEEIEKVFGVDTSSWTQKQHTRRKAYTHAEKEDDKANYDAIFAIRERLKGLRIVLTNGKECTMNGLGYLELGCEMEAHQWMDFLFNQFNVNLAREHVNRKHRLLELEKKVAQNLSIRSWMCDNDQVFCSSRYEHLINQLSARSINEVQSPFSGEFGARDYHKYITIIVRDVDSLREMEFDQQSETYENPMRKGGVGSGSGSGYKSHDKNFYIHPKYGFIIVSTDIQPRQIYGLIHCYGEKASYLFLRYQEQNLEISNWIKKTRSELGLNDLDYAANLTLQQIKSCCEKLIRHKNELEPKLRGLQLMISDGYHVRKGFIEFHWDFNI